MSGMLFRAELVAMNRLVERYEQAEFYRALGFRAGLEVHQQLLTGKKLFCRCPAGFYSGEYDAEILRHMRPTLSELGEYDGTALMEYRTRKEIIYRLNSESVCTYEMDDTPPFEINRKALDIALEIALLLECNMVSEIHVSRKQYLDGSIPTGFQRTTVVGVEGKLPLGERTVTVVQLGLEEDACREVSDIGHERVFLTDRLGMPLIEVVTAPELETPLDAYRAAMAIRSLTRSTGKVRTGSGAARQDVNVSIDGGTRVEIKGVSRIPRIPRLVHNEALRQKALLDIRAELVKRGYRKEDLVSAAANVTRLLARTSCRPIARALAAGMDVVAVRLGGFAGLLSREVQPGRSFLMEFSDRVRVVACLDRLPNVACSDFAGEGLSEEEWRAIMAEMGVSDDDAVVLVWGRGKDLETAVEEIVGRAREAFDGVPSETRQALSDDTNGFERILPGPDRMYPDTDLPPLEISEDHLERVKSSSGISFALWKERSGNFGLGEELELGVYKQGYGSLFLDLVASGGFNPRFLAALLAGPLTKMGRRPSPEEIHRAFSLLAAGEITKDALKAWASGRLGGADLEALARSQGKPPDDWDIDRAIEEIASKEPPLSVDPRAVHDHYIGKLKERFGPLLAGERARRRLEETGLIPTGAVRNRVGQNGR